VAKWCFVGVCGEMALSGQYERSIDQKDRLAIPKALREEFSTPVPTSLYITKGYDDCLELYSPEEFQSFAERLRERTSSEDEFRKFERLFFSSAEYVSIDSQGRIRLPTRFIKEVTLQREVILIGVRNRAEIWNLQKWSEFQSANESKFDEVARNALS
jgi:MraZ protein